MTDWGGLNRRKFPRVNYPCLVVIDKNNATLEDAMLTHTENVSSGGISVILKKNFKMFSTVDIELDLLDLDHHIKCKGKVMWSVRRKQTESKRPNHYDVGLEFVDLEKKEHNRIEDIINKLSQHKKQVL